MTDFRIIPSVEQLRQRETMQALETRYGRTAVVDALREETAALARRIANGPRIAYGYMKRNLFAAETEPLAAVLEMEAVHQARTAMTEDHLEASRAFAEKRRPVFKGR